MLISLKINRGFVTMPLIIDTPTGRSLLHEELSVAFKTDMPVQQALLIARQHYKKAAKDRSMAESGRLAEVPAKNVRR